MNKLQVIWTISQNAKYLENDTI